MKVCVIGGTGLVGRAFVQLAAAHPKVSEVVALVRSVPTRAEEEAEQAAKISYLPFSFEDRAQYRAALHGDVLFSSMGTTLKRAGSKDAQYRVDFEYQYWAAEAAAANGIPRLVLISSHGADPRSLFFYPRIKGKLEEAIAALSFPQISVLRPSLLDGERQESRPFEASSLALFRHLPDWSSLAGLRPIPAKEVARIALEEALASGRAEERLRVLSATDLHNFSD